MPARRPPLLAALLVALLPLAACRDAPPADPPVLRFSGIPDQTPDQVRAQHLPLVEKVCAAARVRCEWLEMPSYEALVDRFGGGQVDVAFFGGVTFAQAQHRHGAVPLAMRDIDGRFTSVIVVPLDSPARSLDDLRGKSFSFGNRSSTSGHLMLRRRLMQRGIVPESHFARIVYAATHDASLRAVAGGEVAAGGLNASVYYQRRVAGDAAARAVRVIWQSPPYADYVWAARPGLSPRLRHALTEAFLDLTPGTAPQALRAQRAAGYVPAFVDDFVEVREVVAAEGRL